MSEQMNERLARKASKQLQQCASIYLCLWIFIHYFLVVVVVFVVPYR